MICELYFWLIGALLVNKSLKRGFKSFLVQSRALNLNDVKHIGIFDWYHKSSNIKLFCSIGTIK